MNEEIPVPITFNTYKHHFQFLLKQTQLWQSCEWEQVEPKLLNIGENLLDFYTGDLTVIKICTECLHYFRINNINDKEDFSKWLYPHEYKKIKLSDSSEWVIKSGKVQDRYIHIHPAKQSLHTIRVRGVTLKTVLGLMIIPDITLTPMNKNLPDVNHIRSKYLHLSPIKSLQRNKGILRLWKLFVNHYQPHCH